MNGIILCDCHSAAVLTLWPCRRHSGYFMAPCEHRAELAALYHCADKAGTCQWLEMLMGLGVGFKHLEWQHPSSTSAGCAVGLLVAFHTLTTSEHLTASSCSFSSQSLFSHATEANSGKDCERGCEARRWVSRNQLRRGLLREACQVWVLLSLPPHH